MQNAQCFECGNPAHHAHHVVPKSMGGTRTIPLCHECHGKIHGIDFSTHVELTKKGLEKAARQGRKGGKPPALSREEVFALADEMKTNRKREDIWTEFGICKATLYRYVSPAGEVRQLPPPKESFFA